MKFIILCWHSARFSFNDRSPGNNRTAVRSFTRRRPGKSDLWTVRVTAFEPFQKFRRTQWGGSVKVLPSSWRCVPQQCVRLSCARCLYRLGTIIVCGWCLGRRTKCANTPTSRVYFFQKEPETREYFENLICIPPAEEAVTTYSFTQEYSFVFSHLSRGSSVIAIVVVVVVIMFYSALGCYFTTGISLLRPKTTYA